MTAQNPDINDVQGTHSSTVSH